MLYSSVHHALAQAVETLALGNALAGGAQAWPWDLRLLLEWRPLHQLISSTHAAEHQAAAVTRFALHSVLHPLAPADCAAHDDARVAEQQRSRTQRDDCATCGTEPMQQGPVHALLLRQMYSAVQGSARDRLLHRISTVSLFERRCDSERYVTLSMLLWAAMKDDLGMSTRAAAAQPCQNK